MTMVNIKGDSDQPCLVPFVILKELDITPDVHTFALGVKYRLRIAFRNIFLINQTYARLPPGKFSVLCRTPSLHPRKGAGNMSMYVLPIE